MCRFFFLSTFDFSLVDLKLLLLILVCWKYRFFFFLVFHGNDRECPWQRVMRKTEKKQRQKRPMKYENKLFGLIMTHAQCLRLCISCSTHSLNIKIQCDKLCYLVGLFVVPFLLGSFLFLWQWCVLDMFVYIQNYYIYLDYRVFDGCCAWRGTVRCST